jgi:uncharacterized protein DUF6171
MNIDWAGIREGLKNQIAPLEEDRVLIEQTREERMAICRECEYYKMFMGVTPQCGHCGCILKTKTSCPHCQCPINKWMPVLTKQETEKLKELRNGNS